MKIFCERLREYLWAVNTAVRIRSRLGQPCWVINTLRSLLIKGFFQSLIIIIFIANWGLPYKSLHRVYKHEMHFTVACIISKIEIINWCLLYFFLFMQSWFQFIYSSWQIFKNTFQTLIHLDLEHCLWPFKLKYTCTII